MSTSTMTRARRRPRTFDTRPGDRIIFGGAVYIVPQKVNKVFTMRSVEDEKTFDDLSEDTKQAIRDSHEGRNINHYSTLEEMYAKLGI